MFHIYGMVAFVAGFLATGSTVVVLPNSDLDNMLSAIDKYRAAHMPCPALGAAHPRRSKGNMGCRGGAPLSLSKEGSKGFQEKYPAVGILQVYGLTESPMGASTESLEESRRYGTVGLLSYVQHGGEDSGPGQWRSVAGEPDRRAMAKRSRCHESTVGAGYFNNEEATTSTLDSEGWLKTGDLCFFDEDGFIFVVDRLKELIKYKGYQVPPAELEALLLTHPPEIADAAVIPFSDPKVGQYPMTYLVRKPGADHVSDKVVMEFIA